MALSSLLSCYLADTGQEVRIIKNKHGKPSLEGSDFVFNLTHSGGCAVIGFSRGVHLGVDVELVRERESLFELMSRYFSDEERLWVLDGVGSDDQSVASISLGGKRGLSKALVGLTIDLASFSVRWLAGSVLL